MKDCLDELGNIEKKLNGRLSWWIGQSGSTRIYAYNLLPWRGFFQLGSKHCESLLMAHNVAHKTIFTTLNVGH